MKESKLLKSLFLNVRDSLTYGVPLQGNYDSLFSFDENISQIYITLFQEKNQPLRWGSKKETLSKTIDRVIFKLRENPTFKNFAIKESSTCRVLFEIVTKEYECSIRNATSMVMNSPNRFESGVTGFKYTYNGITRFFMPTDGYTHSIMTMKQLLNHLSKQCGVSKLTDKISQRADLMRREPIEYKFLLSDAYISYNDEVLKLERGYPLPIEFNQEVIYDKTLKSLDWLVENMNEDGSFLYYYDPYKNTIVDDMHPNMINPLYNNILRHSGGTISLLRGYEISQNELYLKKAKKSLDFLISTFRTHTYKKKFACYPFFNKKSKLGGAGIGLVALMHYYMLTGDACYQKEMDGLVRHILSRVDKDGEMLGYYIHPKFNEGKALINPSDEVKKELFSFYYPGEALLGLALYYRHVEISDKKLKEDIRVKSEMALDFLVDVRPIRYDYMFESLPADAWLMQAIEEWVKVDGLDKKSYIDFVFNDTKQMFEHMYKEENTLPTNKDYIGGFYYNYGDHVYHDASRCEGVVSAYYLAKHLKDEVKAAWIMEHMLLSAKGLMKTFHDEKSVYPHADQKKALHSFRFKLTRQWVRVDSVQHAACFFARLYKTDFETSKTIDTKYKIIEILDEAGYSSVYKVENQQDSKEYALKLITHPRYINLLENEQKALSIMNEISKLKFYEFANNGEDTYFVFDYAKDGNTKKYVEKNGPLSEEKVFNFLLDLTETLLFTKKHNMLHLDLKPANILYHNNRFCLSDWGNTHFASSASSLHLKGNPIYTAPEFYYGSRSFASEMYSLGCSLYFLLTGKHIFELRNRDALVKKIYSHIYLTPDLSAITSEKMRFLVSKMLDKNPKTRITIEEVAEFLEESTTHAFEINTHFKEESVIDLDDEYTLYKKMAFDNIAFAQDKYARYFLDTNIHEAITWFEQAANQGYAIAQNKLALLYFDEKFGVQDYTKAFTYFEKAAKQNFDMALYYMGIFYEEGILVEKNTHTALDYFMKSARTGYKKAYKKLETYSYKLDF